MPITAEHTESRTVHDIAVDPDHEQRTESAEFRDAKKRLHADGHMHCYVCGTESNLQVHHRACEYMFADVVDYAKLKEFVEEWDIYGYGKLLRHKPITSPDDVRNQMVLCQEHHTGVDHADGGGGTGIHYLPFPEWIMQKLALDGADPVPQAGETLSHALTRVKAHERHGEG
jgi:hypothetical protein